MRSVMSDQERSDLLSPPRVEKSPVFYLILFPLTVLFADGILGRQWNLCCVAVLFLLIYLAATRLINALLAIFWKRILDSKDLK